MKQFILKLILFLAIPLFYFVGNMVINYYIYTSTPVNINNTRLLIAGDSHPANSVNPDLFTSAQNISQSAESYILTFWKLKKIYQSYQPDTLILGFSTHNISQFNDYKFSSDRWSIEMFKRSYPIENFKAIKNKIPIDYYEYYKLLWNKTAYYPKKNHVNYIGGYGSSEYSDISNWPTTIKRHYYWEEKVLGVSETSVNYLDSILQMNQRLGIVVILTSNPVYSKYFDAIPTPIIEKFYALKEKYKNQTILFEKTQDQTYPDSLLLNADHLNKNGATRFSGELITYLKSLKNTPKSNIK